MDDPNEHIVRYCLTSDLMTRLRCVLRGVGLEPGVVVEQTLLDAFRKATAARIAFDQAQGRAA